MAVVWAVALQLSQDGRAYLLSHADKTAVASPTGGHWLSAQLSPRRPTPLLSLTAAWRRAIFRAAGGAVCCAGERHLPACVLGGSFIVCTPWWGYLGRVALPSGVRITQSRERPRGQWRQSVLWKGFRLMLDTSYNVCVCDITCTALCCVGVKWTQVCGCEKMSVLLSLLLFLTCLHSWWSV